MTINPSELYPEEVDHGVPGYPWGRARNSRPGAPGTPFDKNWLNCHWGATQSLLRRAGLAPNGRPDTRNDSQFLEAIELLSRAAVEQDRRRFDVAGLVPVNRVAGPRSMAIPVRARSDAALTSVAMSRDGKRLFGLWSDGFAGQLDIRQPGTLGPPNIQTQFVRKLVEEETSDATGLTFRPDGLRYWVCLRDRATITRELQKPWDISEGEVFETAAALGPVALDWSPDGRHCVTIAGQQITSLTLREPYALNDASESTTFAVTHLERLTGVAVSPDGRTVVVAGRGEAEPHRTLVQFYLDVPWDVSAAVYSQQVAISNSRFLLEDDARGAGSITGIAWRSDGAALLAASTDGLALQLEAVEVVA